MRLLQFSTLASGMARESTTDLFALPMNLPLHGSAPDWQFLDFLKLNHTEQHRLKLALATHLGVRWGSVNKDSAFANSIDGVKAYDESGIDAVAKKFKESKGSDGVTVSTVINICQVGNSWAFRT
jgi:hypothetical protein